MNRSQANGETTISDLIAGHIAQLTFESYRASVNANIRGLLLGHFDRSAFSDGMARSLQRGFERAWQEGADQCGISPEERTTEETDALAAAVATNVGFVPAFAQFIIDYRDRALAAGNKVVFGGVLRSRAQLWHNRYQDIVNQAHTLACQDQKMEWVLGPTDHCSSCIKLGTLVKRGSVWASSGVRPQSPDLACGGFRCQCALRATDAPATPGRVPAIP